MPGAAGLADLVRDGAQRQLASDGLLTFREIFDLKLDADLVILSACDTAAEATAAATREAGLTAGGDFALDGLVRAFIGAGGRSVVASHWPLPDNFGATERLISGMFRRRAGKLDRRRAAHRAAPADGRGDDLASLLLVGLRRDRRRRPPGAEVALRDAAPRGRIRTD